MELNRDWLDIDDQKERFIKLLRSSYEFQKDAGYIFTKNTSTEIGTVTIEDKVLKQYGFDGRYFWEVICHTLKKQGIIKSYRDPDISSVYEEYYEHFPEYKRLTKKLDELLESLPSAYAFMKASVGLHDDKFYERGENYKLKSIDKEIEKTRNELHEITQWIKGQFTHTFIVDENKLNKSSIVTGLKNKKISYDSDGAKIFIDQKIVDIPKDSYEQYVCKVMFDNKHPLGSPVLVADIYEEITGKDLGMQDIYAKLKKVTDAMSRVNKKVKDEVMTTDNLFRSEKKLIIRNF